MTHMPSLIHTHIHVRVVVFIPQLNMHFDFHVIHVQHNVNRLSIFSIFLKWHVCAGADKYPNKPCVTEIHQIQNIRCKPIKQTKQGKNFPVEFNERQFAASQECNSYECKFPIVQDHVWQHSF